MCKEHYWQHCDWSDMKLLEHATFIPSTLLNGYEFCFQIGRRVNTIKVMYVDMDICMYSGTTALYELRPTSSVPASRPWVKGYVWSAHSHPYAVLLVFSAWEVSFPIVIQQHVLGYCKENAQLISAPTGNRTQGCAVESEHAIQRAPWVQPLN